MPFNIGPGELIIVLIIALIVVGPGRLPDVGASLGKSIREFRKAAADVKESTSMDAPSAPAAPAATQATPPEQSGPRPPRSHRHLPCPPCRPRRHPPMSRPRLGPPKARRAWQPWRPRRSQGPRKPPRQDPSVPAEVAPADEQQSTPSA